MAVIRGASYTYVYPAFDLNTRALRTGDAANQTVLVSKDGANFVQASSAPVELTLPGGAGSGIYRVSLSASEMDANTVAVLVRSTTANVFVPPATILTERGRIDTTLSSRATAQEVWNYTTRALTAGVTVSGYATGMSPAQQILLNVNNKIKVDEFGDVYLADEDHTMIQNDVVAGLAAGGFTPTRAGYLDELSPSGRLYAIDSVVSTFRFDGNLVRAKAEQVTDKTGYALSSSGQSGVAEQVWNTARGTRTAGTFGYYLDAQVSSVGGGSGGGGTDWTADERAQIRYVLGIDGTQQAPGQNTPGWIRDIRGKTQQLQFDANNRVRALTEVNQDKTGYSLTQGEHTTIIDDVVQGLEAKGYTSTRASYLDVSISSRLPASAYTAPDNAGIAAIRLKTDNLSFTGSNVNARAAVVVDKTGYTLAPSEHTSIAQAVWSFVVETGYSALKLMRLFASVLLGKCSGGGTGTITFRNINDTKNRVVASVDQNSNRVSVTLDGD